MAVVKRDTAPESPRARGDFDLRQIWAVLWRQRTLVALVTLLVVTGVTVFSLLQTPTYESEARIHITEERPGFRVMADMIPMGLGQMAGLATGNVQTDIAILRSRQIAEAVVDSLHLQVKLRSPRRAREDVFTVFQAPRQEIATTFHLRLDDDGTYSVGGQAPVGVGTVPARVTIGERYEIHGVELALNPMLRGNPPQQIQVELGEYRRTVGKVQRALHVYRPDPGAQLVSVRFRSGDPVFAAAVPNVVTESFIRYKNRVSRSESHHTIDFLQEQATTYEQQLRDAEARLQRYREQAQIVEPTTQASEGVRQLAQLQANRDGLAAERESLARLLARMDAPTPGVSGANPAYRQLAAFPAFLSSGSVQNLLRELTELESQRAELRVRRTEQNVDVRGVQERISELEVQLYQLARSYLDALDTQIAALDGNLARFDAQLGTIPAREVEFLRLTREQKLLDQVYTLIQTRLKEAQIHAASEPANVQVVDAALVPQVRASPRRTLNVAIGLVVGLVLATGLALGRQAMNTRVQSAEEAASLTALPVLGVIPTPPHGWQRRNGKNRISGVGQPPLIMDIALDHPTAEAFRSLRTHLVLLSPDQAPRVLTLTSAAEAAGKSVFAANLAITFARQGTSTLLVDGDLREGALHDLLGFPQAPGLSEVLLERTTWTAAVHHVDVGPGGAPMHFLSSGVDPAGAPDVVVPARLHALLNTIREAYEVVILEAPSVRRSPAATLLAAASDVTLLTAHVEEVERGALGQAARQLQQLNLPVRGMVLSAVDASLSGNVRRVLPRIFS